MDTDAYASFVTVDVESISCLFRLGVMGGTQYADIADDVLSQPPRYFRHALECTKRAVEYYKSRGVTVVAHLGDVLAAENSDSGTQWTALQSFNNVRHKIDGTTWHVAPGPCDTRCFGPDGVGPALSSASGQTSNRTYYSFFPAARWRVLVLDANDATGGFSAASSSPGVPDGILIGGSGSLGPAQLTWLSAQLSVASAEGERVLIMSNRGVRGAHALINADAVRERISAYPGTVAAVLSLGDGNGHYEKDAQGVHHVSPLAVIGRDLNQDAFGCLEVYDDKLKLDMHGASPLASEWPLEALELPRGGQLVSGADTAAFGYFLSFLFFMLNVFSMPLQPVFRMLTSNEDAGNVTDAEEGLPAPVFHEDSTPGQLGADGAIAPVAPAAPASGASADGSSVPPNGEGGVIV